ncbi:MAG: metal-dependent hydrolase, partial [Zoogloea sp.]|nr:metal-dependent hydrolase [Zoogloea sp.]
MKQSVRLLVVLAVLALVPALLPPYYVTLLNYIGISALVAVGLVLLTGVGGLTSFGQAAFVGVGAYTTAVLTTADNLPGWLAWAGQSPWLALIVGLVITATIALLLGSLTLKLSGHYLPLGTIAWGISLYFLFGTLDFLGAQSGISGLPPVSIGSWVLDEGSEIYYLIWAFVMAAVITTQNLLDSREGRAIRALKGGVVMAEAMGVNTSRSRIVIFVIAALHASAAGWLYAHMQRLVNPSPFGLHHGIEYLFMAVVGGAGYVWGAVIGSGLVTLLNQWLQDWLPKLFGHAGNYEIIIFGMLLLLILHRAREGMWPAVLRVLRIKAEPKKLVDTAAALPRRTMPTRGEVILEVKDVTRRFGGLVANNQMNFNMHAG